LPHLQVRRRHLLQLRQSLSPELHVLLRLRKHLKLLKSVTGRGIGGKEAESVASAAPILPPEHPLNIKGTNCEEHEYN
jgi:hypothetical protein